MNPPFEPGTWTVVSILASVFIGYIGVALAGHELTSRGVPNYMQWALAVLSATSVLLASLAIRWVSALRPYSETATGQGSTTVHLSETGFSVHGPGQSLTAMWASLRRIAETTEFFLLYVSDVRAVVLPKRAVPNEATEQIQAIRQREEQRIARAFALWGRRFPWG